MATVSKPPVANLTPAALSKVEALEKSLGDVCVVAYEKPLTPAQLKPQQVKLLKNAERDLGVCLVAYQV